jgi:hypothetical protein
VGLTYRESHFGTQFRIGIEILAQGQGLQGGLIHWKRVRFAFRLGDELVGNHCYWLIPHRLSHTEDQQCLIIYSHFVSIQFSPASASTFKGTDNSTADSITATIFGPNSGHSSGGTSNTSSSCTCNNKFALYPFSNS